MSHTCHARGCTTVVPPKLLMCLYHWRMVPRDLQRAVWATYRKSQEVDKQPSKDYLEAARAAINAVAAKEQATTERVHALFLEKLAAEYPNHPWLKRGADNEQS